MDFITNFSRTSKKHDSIIVVVEKLTKATHFILVKSEHKASNIVEIYRQEIAKLYGVPKTIVSDRDSKFTSNF
jgi:site-specific DNA-adenine methylase